MCQPYTCCRIDITRNQERWWPPKQEKTLHHITSQFNVSCVQRSVEHTLNSTGFRNHRPTRVPILIAGYQLQFLTWVSRRLAPCCLVRRVMFLDHSVGGRIYLLRNVQFSYLILSLFISQFIMASDSEKEPQQEFLMTVVMETIKEITSKIRWQNAWFLVNGTAEHSNYEFETHN